VCGTHETSQEIGDVGHPIFVAVQEADVISAGAARIPALSENRLRVYPDERETGAFRSSIAGAE
jgi:hypothetical protein